MAGWSLEREGAPATAVVIVPLEGAIRVERSQQTQVFDALDGTRVVWATPAGPRSVNIPRLRFTSASELARLEALVISGAAMILRADTGETYRVRALGGLRWEVLDYPGRATAPLYDAELDLVGV